jgi:hypothetical protein
MNYSDGYILNKKEVTVTLTEERATHLIIQRAKQIVSRLIERRGHGRPPFLPAEFSRLLGIKRIVKAELGETSAILLKYPDGYVVKVNQKQNLFRQNFSCAHEIGHILFNELKLEQYIRNIEYRTFNPQGEHKARAAAIERLCDIAARELLMPEQTFGQYLSNFGISIRSIEWLSTTFRVSIQSSAIRIAEVSPEPCIVLLWRPWPRSKPKGLRLGWRAGPEKNSQGKVNYMPVHKFVRHPSKLFEAYKQDKPTKSLKLFSVNNNTKRLPMESKGFGYGETRYVLSIAPLYG